MSPLGLVAADAVVVLPTTVVEDDLATDVLVTAGSGVVGGPFVPIVVVREVISSEELSEESLESHFFSHSHFCRKTLQSLMGPRRR